MTFVFFDAETTGISPAFDQILQFAAVVTDDNLNEVSRFELRSRLLPYIIPSPHALKVTGQMIDDLLDSARPSYYQFVCEIRQTLLAYGPATYIGYNSLKFDEEILRQAFFQNLFPPFLTNTGGNRRADALHLMRAAAVLYPDALAPAFNDKGGRSYKLDRLAPVNGFNHINAHDALADVEALIHLCRIVRDRCPELWARFQQFASKVAVEDFLDTAEAFFLLEFHPSTTGKYFVSPIGTNNANVVYCYDLTIDPDELRVLSDVELDARLSKSPRPLRKVKANAAPCLCALGDAPKEMLGDVSAAELVRRARELRSDRALVERLVAAASDAETDFPRSPYVEKQIYDGFWSRRDDRRLEAFHAAAWEHRVAIVETLEDSRLKWLARRLMFVERPYLLAPEQHATITAEMARRMIAGPAECGGWATLNKAGEDLAEMLAGVEAKYCGSLNRLQMYFDNCRERCDRIIRHAGGDEKGQRGN